VRCAHEWEVGLLVAPLDTLSLSTAAGLEISGIAVAFAGGKRKGPVFRPALIFSNWLAISRPDR